MTKCLITGGAGFIGRWLVRELIERGCDVVALDNLTNSSPENLRGLNCEFIRGDINDGDSLQKAFAAKPDICFHLAAHVVVHDSIVKPVEVYRNDVMGTLALMEACRAHGTRTLLVSSCMVYDAADAAGAIDETYPVKPASPYAAAKLAAEHLVMSYHYAYGLPCTVVRPFNTYGPFQKSNSEGGVVSVFIVNEMKSEDLRIYGNGVQTRDLLYVEDCARFIADAGFCDEAVGLTINAGTGRDISINDLARAICADDSHIRRVRHIHPQSEIMRLCCDPGLAKKLLGWEAKIPLEEGIKRTREWLGRRRA